MQRKRVFAATLAASLLAFGAAAQAQGFDPYGDIDRDGIQNRNDGDRDGDGLANRSDPNPNIFNRTRIAPRAHDMDGDGIADRSDRDRDGDGIANARDPNPNVPNDRYARAGRFGPYGDLDRDGIANRVDRDRDGDGVRNARDAFPDNRRRA